MSIRHLDAALAHSKSEGAARLVLLALAHRMSTSTHFAFPSMPLLMHETHLSERSIRNAINSLLDLGEIIRDVENGQRGFRFTLTCPPGCNGDNNHARNLSTTKTNKRDYETERKRAQRARKKATQDTRTEDTTRQKLPTHPVLEPPIEEMSRQNLPGHPPLEPPIEELSRQNLPGHTPPRSPNRRVVPAKSAGLSRQNLPGQAPDTSLREPEILTTTKEPNTPNPRKLLEPEAATEVEAEVVGGVPRAAAPGGGNDTSKEATLGELVETARTLVPRQLAIQITRPALARALTHPLARGITPRDLRRALLARNFDGAGPGAVITYLRDLEPLPEPTITRTHCPIHDTDTTRLKCPKCVTQTRARGRTMAKRPGESLTQWVTRLNHLTSERTHS